MTFEELKKEAKDIGLYLGLNKDMIRSNYRLNGEKIDGERFLSQEYHTGGYSGGNCWNDDEPTYSDAWADEDKGFTYLDKLLEVVAPKITYLQYKRMDDIIKEDTYTEYEYYGNSSDYKVYMVDLEELNEYLNEIEDA